MKKEMAIKFQKHGYSSTPEEFANALKSDFREDVEGGYIVIRLSALEAHMGVKGAKAIRGRLVESRDHADPVTYHFAEF